MQKERNVQHCLMNMLRDENVKGDYWRGYAEALADVLDIKIIEI